MSENRTGLSCGTQSLHVGGAGTQAEWHVWGRGAPSRQQGRAQERLSDKAIGLLRGCRVQGPASGVRVWKVEQRLGPVALLPTVKTCFSLVTWEDPGA